MNPPFVSLFSGQIEVLRIAPDGIRWESDVLNPTELAWFREEYEVDQHEVTSELPALDSARAVAAAMGWRVVPIGDVESEIRRLRGRDVAGEGGVETIY